MKQSKEFTYEYWHKYLCDIGFKNFRIYYYDNLYNKNGVIVQIILSQLTTILPDRSELSFRLLLNFYEDTQSFDKKDLISVVVDENKTDKLKEVYQVIEAIVDSEKIPLLAGIDWAGPIMEYLL
jgi:hypothetical protein